MFSNSTTYLTTFLTLLLITATTIQAYTLQIFFVDGLEVRVTGDHSSPCQNLPVAVKGDKISSVKFDKGGQLVNVFDVYSDLYCTGDLLKRGGEGTHQLDKPVEGGSFKIS